MIFTEGNEGNKDSMARFAILFFLRYLRFLLLLLSLITQAEIITEHGLERFGFAMLKVTNVRQVNRPESGSDFFYVRTLSPD
jgi:hypothetical protein